MKRYLIGYPVPRKLVLIGLYRWLYRHRIKFHDNGWLAFQISTVSLFIQLAPTVNTAGVYSKVLPATNTWKYVQCAPAFTMSTLYSIRIRIFLCCDRVLRNIRSCLILCLTSCRPKFGIHWSLMHEAWISLNLPVTGITVTTDKQPSSIQGIPILESPWGDTRCN